MPTLSSVACANCGRFMQASKTGQVVEELDNQGGPYKVWVCDEFTCPDCGAKVVTGFGRSPIAEHYQREYASVRERAAYQLR